MLSSFKKNLRNRFEEGYGDAKNLRGRHPLAALGFLYIIAAHAPDTSKAFAIDMLRKLVREADDVYDCACLLVVDGTQGRVEESDVVPDDRGPEEESASLVASESDQSEDDEEDEDQENGDEDRVDNVNVATVTLLLDEVPDDLSAGSFFDTLTRSALERTPVAMYPVVRERVPK
jgi:hypothetical protein